MTARARLQYVFGRELRPTDSLPPIDGSPSLTVSLRQLKLEARHDALKLGPKEQAVVIDRPKTRADCVYGPRPCPFVGCRHHLYLEATKAGSILINHPDIEPNEMTVSCSLDLADDGPLSLGQVGAVLNVVRERVRQVQDASLVKISRGPLGEAA